MASGEQKRRILDARRKAQAELMRLRTQAEAREKALADVADLNAVRVNREALAPNNSYGEPDFVTRGFYVDQPFQCACCGAEETWRATQQKWWYEVAKGPVYSTAKYCIRCRRKRREGGWRQEDANAESRRARSGR
jgi:hypothetical protein